ncbi:glycosyltransferase, partial [Pantoea vagans]|uniref:glycosyltransferase n=1 Tax=Pantoea vagans TaxID=470934 RepID=UPI002897D77A
MSTSPLLSIITPMYNAGSMFDEFMHSLLAQTLTLLEIIIVDDGSTDGSGERADLYAQQPAHIRVIHQEHGGVSRARNAGIAIARGKYFTFPDSDDTMQPDLYQTLVPMADADHLDSAPCTAEWVFKHSPRV